MYPISMTLTISNALQLAAIMAAVGVDTLPAATSPAPKAEEEKPKKPSSAAAAAKASESSKPATEAETTEQKAAGTADAASADPAAARAKDLGAEGDKIATLDYPAVSKAITDSVKAKGRDAVVATLNSFGAAKGTDLKAEQYAEFVEALAALPNVGA